MKIIKFGEFRRERLKNLMHARTAQPMLVLVINRRRA